MVDFIVGVDLGQAQDPSAVVVLHRQWWKAGQRPSPETARLWHTITTIHQWELMTPYPKIVEEILETYWLVEREHAEARVALVVDAGGPGRPVIDMLKQHKTPPGAVRARPIPVTFTGGDQPHERDDGSITVPRLDICSALIVAYQAGEVKLNPELRFAEEFDRQVKSFHYVVKPKSQTIQYETREGQIHDDLVMTAAMGFWYSTQRLSPRFPGSRSKARVQAMHNPIG